MKATLLASRTRQTVENLQRRCDTLNKLLQIDTAIIMANTHQKIKEGRAEQQQIHYAQSRTLDAIQDHVGNQEARREYEAILKWLTPIEYAPQFSDFMRHRQPGTGQ